jgi:glucose-1-phosphate cytidylyltransferase
LVNSIFLILNRTYINISISSNRIPCRKVPIGKMLILGTLMMKTKNKMIRNSLFNNFNIDNNYIELLAGGFGTRISEESYLKPKPMVEIGDKPIIWHIMKIYSHYGINEFIICLGYKGYLIKEYFSNFLLHSSDFTIDMQKNSFEFHNKSKEHWKVTLVDTGLNTMTGGRLKRLSKYLGNETFCMTYGDGLSNINIKKLISFHKKNKLEATVAGIYKPERFGKIKSKNNIVTDFSEKPTNLNFMINGGFFVLNPSVIKYIKNDNSIWERKPLEKLTKKRQLGVYMHRGFWHSMDTLRDKKVLEEMWSTKTAPWKIWK